jgi:hypothetical protein
MKACLSASLSDRPPVERNGRDDGRCLLLDESDAQVLRTDSHSGARPSRSERVEETMRRFSPTPDTYDLRWHDGSRDRPSPTQKREGTIIKIAFLGWRSVARKDAGNQKRLYSYEH